MRRELKPREIEALERETIRSKDPCDPFVTFRVRVEPYTDDDGEPVIWTSIAYEPRP